MRLRGTSRRTRILAVALGSAVAEAAVVARRRGSLLGVEAIVRCRDGHLFTTIWIPGASLKALRLGWWRYQRCPVGRHWSFVTPVREAALSDEDRRRARRARDSWIP